VVAPDVAHHAVVPLAPIGAGCHVGDVAVGGRELPPDLVLDVVDGGVGPEDEAVRQVLAVELGAVARGADDLAGAEPAGRDGDVLSEDGQAVEGVGGPPELLGSRRRR
jgi:hypothetical protein